LKLRFIHVIVWFILMLEICTSKNSFGTVRDYFCWLNFLRNIDWLNRNQSTFAFRMRSKLFNWDPLSFSWVRSVSTILIISSDNSHLSSVFNWLLNNLSLILRSLLSIATELRNHSVFFDPVGVVAWSCNLLALIVRLLLDVLNYFFNLFLLILTALFFFNHFVLFFILVSLFLLNICFRSIALRNYFRKFSFNSSCFNLFHGFSFFKSPNFNLSFFFNSDSFSLDFGFFKLFFSFNIFECFLLCFSSFISQFLDFILFNHLFSFDSLDDCEFFLFNSFKLFIFSLFLQFLLSLKSFPFFFSFSFKSETFLLKFPRNMVFFSLNSFFFKLLFNIKFFRFNIQNNFLFFLFNFNGDSFFFNL